MNAYLLGQQVPEVWNFGLFTIAKVGYRAQVIPALLAGPALGFIETRLKRIVPDYLYGDCPGLLADPRGVPRARHYRSVRPPDRRRRGLRGTPSVNRQLRADRRRAVRLPLRAAGDYRCPPDHPRYRYADDPEHGRYPGVAADCAVEYCRASAVVGIIIASRKQNEREISVPAAISAYLGVTEPAMYGINLKYRFPMLCAMIGSGLAGLLCGLNGVLANGIGVGGLPGILPSSLPTGRCTPWRWLSRWWCQLSSPAWCISASTVRAPCRLSNFFRGAFGAPCSRKVL